MARFKSILKTANWEKAAAKRTCKHNKKHHINKGDNCFVIREGYNRWNYCEECGKQIIEQAKTDLNKLIS